MDLWEHLDFYGIRHFTDEGEYFSWGGEQLGERRSKELNKLRKPLQRGKAKSYEVRRFYEYIANPDIAGIVHSLKAGAIHASGLAIAPHLKDKMSILDVGCNIGYLTTWYASCVPESKVVGIDFSEKSVQIANKYAKELGVSNVEFRVVDITKDITVEPSIYDLVVDTQSLDDFIGVTDAFMKIFDVLSEDGCLVSVAALPSVEKCDAYLQALREPGFKITGFDWQPFSDVGAISAYPVIKAMKNADEEIILDAAQLYQQAESVRLEYATSAEL